MRRLGLVLALLLAVARHAEAACPQEACDACPSVLCIDGVAQTFNDTTILCATCEGVTCTGGASSTLASVTAVPIRTDSTPASGAARKRIFARFVGEDVECDVRLDLDQAGAVPVGTTREIFFVSTTTSTTTSTSTSSSTSSSTSTSTTTSTSSTTL